MVIDLLVWLLNCWVVIELTIKGSIYPLLQPIPLAFSLAPLSAGSLGESGRVSLGDVTAHGRIQD